uniref:Rho-GAP domain-containing protein n=2 Tax=Wuchereria bancrofti TaxID=6293 RepID=A0A1I8EZQ7_WUCBA
MLLDLIHKFLLQVTSRKNMEEKKRTKAKREDYRPLETKERSKKGIVFNRRSRNKNKEGQHVAKEVPFVSPFTGEHAIFAVPLSLAVLRMGSHDGIPLPVVVRQCIDYINEKGTIILHPTTKVKSCKLILCGLCVEGIHRISAPKANLDKLEEAVNSRHSIQLKDVHDASGLLKRFLRQLPEHILTNEKRPFQILYISDCPCGTLSPCRCLVADMLKAQLISLPEENYMLLAYIFIHSQMILQNSGKNKMGMAALGLILQATLNVSQAIVRIFLLNASDVILMKYHSPSMVYLFKDVQIKQYVAPKSPKIICEGDLSDSEEGLRGEERKQRSRLQQLHLQIEELRELNLPTKQTEEELWDVQTAITMLNRKLKSIRMENSGKIETRKNDGPTPTLEMFEEKQLLAACTALREDIARHKLEIIALDHCLNAMENKNFETLKNIDDEYGEEYWRDECLKEEKERDNLLSEIVSLRNACCQLRAQIELNAVKRLTLLVTRF